MTAVVQRATPPTEQVRDVDELDMALLDAMHVNPRASFEQRIGHTPMWDDPGLVVSTIRSLTHVVDTRPTE